MVMVLQLEACRSSLSKSNRPLPIYAGRYSEDLQDRYGNAFRNAKVAVQTLVGGAVTLYADRTKTAYVPASGLAANEIKADSRGNLIFFADPGNYQIVVTPVGGSTLAAFPISVLPDPLEPDASEGALQAEEAARIAGDDALQIALNGKQPIDADLTAIAALDSATAGTIASDGVGWIKKTYAQFKTALGLAKADVGLSNVDNTSDANKPVSTDQAAAIGLVEAVAVAIEADYARASDQILVELETDYNHPVSDTTLAEVVGLRISLPANTLWRYTLLLWGKGPPTADLTYRVLGPTGAVGRFFAQLPSIDMSLSTGNAIYTLAPRAFNQALQHGTRGVGSTEADTGIVEGVIEIGGTAGDITLHAAQRVSDPGICTILAGTTVHLTRIR